MSSEAHLAVSYSKPLFCGRCCAIVTRKDRPGPRGHATRKDALCHMLLKRIASADSRHARILLKASLGSREQRRFNISGETPTAISIDNHVTCKRNIAEKSRESPSCNPSDSEVGGRCHGADSEFSLRDLSCCHLLHRILSRCSDGETLNRLLTASLASRIKTRLKEFAKEEKEVEYQRFLYEFAFDEVGYLWRQLGIWLGVSPIALDSLEQYCQARSFSVQETALRMLQTYWKDKGSQMASPRNLRQALRCVSQRDNASSESGRRRSSIPFPPDIKDGSYVFGREDELKCVLGTYFWDGVVGVRNCRVQQIDGCKLQIVFGGGGVGKTTLAFCYALRFAKAYQNGVFYFSAESHASLAASVEKNVKILSISTSQPSQSLYPAFWKHLRRNPRSLIIIDNADSLDVLNDFICGTLPSCHVVVTTRSGVKSHPIFRACTAVNFLHLKSLNGDTALSALLRWAGYDDKNSIDSVELEYARRLAVQPPVEGLPLALSHAGVFVANSEITFRKYSDLLQGKINEFEAAATNLETCLRYFHLSHLKGVLRNEEGVDTIDDLCLFDMTKSRLNLTNGDQRLLTKCLTALKERRLVWLTWELDLDRVRESKSPHGQSILELCSVLSSQNIPKELIQRTALLQWAQFAEFYFVKGAMQLKERSLIQESAADNDNRVFYSMHNLIQASVFERLQADRERLRDTLSCAENVLLSIILSNGGPVKFFHLHKPDVVLPVLPHVYSVAQKKLEFCSEVFTEYPDIVDCACRLSLMNAHIETAKDLISKRLALFKKAHLSDEERKKRQFDCYSSFAVVCNALHQFDETERVILVEFFGVKAIDELKETDVGDNWPLLCLLANAYRRRSVKKAVKVLDKVCAVFDVVSVAPADLVGVLFSANVVYSSAGEHVRRLTTLRRIESLCLKFNASFYLAFCYREFGECLSDLEKFQEAISYYEKCLSLYKQCLAPNDFKVAEVYCGLSTCFLKTQRFHKALEFSKEAMEIAESSLPPDHSGLTKYLFGHACCLREIGKSAEAIHYFYRTLSTLRHSNSSIIIEMHTHYTLRYLGELLVETERTEKAADHLRESSLIADRLCTSGHLEKKEGMLVMTEVGQCYCKMQHWTEAVMWLDKALALAKTVWSPDNHQLRAAVNNYVNSLIGAQRFDEVDAFLSNEKILRVSQLPLDHPYLQLLDLLFVILDDYRRKCISAF